MRVELSCLFLETWCSIFSSNLARVYLILLTCGDIQVALSELRIGFSHGICGKEYC